MMHIITEVRHGYSRTHRFFEITGIAVFASLMLALCAQLSLQLPNEEGYGLWITACVFVGILVSDFLSGAAHWAGDTLGDESTPLLGKHFIAPFRQHHVVPHEITRHEFIEVNGNTCIALVPVLLLLMWITPSAAGFSLFVCVTFAFACFFVFCTNQFHKWAHEMRPPSFVRFLQTLGVILSPERHSIHHAHLDDHYCITVGWLNPLLAKIRFFRLAESVVLSLRLASVDFSDRPDRRFRNELLVVPKRHIDI